MGIIRGFSLIFLANGIALYVAGMMLPEISLSQTVEGFAATGGVLTLINLLIKPLIRLALGPILLLTLGLGSVLVNVVTLLSLDVLLPTITIDGLTNLLMAGLIVGISNLVISLTARFI